MAPWGSSGKSVSAVRHECWASPAHVSGGFDQEEKSKEPVIFVYRVLKLSDIGMMVRVFANGPENLDSIPGGIIQKTQKMVLDASLLNTQHYKVRIKGKVEQSRERSSALPNNLV